MIIEVALALSVLLNVFMGWYMYRLLRNMLEITDAFDDMRSKLIEFATHLKAINSVESFYGDPTITALVKHMKTLASDIEDYTKMIVFYEDEIEEDPDESTEEN